MIFFSKRISVSLSAFILMACLCGAAFGGLHPSFSSDAKVDTLPFYPDGKYSTAIPTPNSRLQQQLGVWPASYRELVEYINLVADQSDRVVMETHGRSHEGRDLFNVFISSAANIQSLEAYRTKTARLANPESISSSAEVEEIVADLPLVAWLGYSIHGDEISGVDAALQLIYHLAAAEDSATLHLLDNVIIIIDPIQNPDGRERYLSMLRTYQSSVPNYDRHAMQHQGVWPWGRGNHYLFDLNRDWILLTQPETKGKLQTLLHWNPQLVVDAHEMGSSDNFLFSPPREPVNYQTPSSVRRWWKIFSSDQAKAFDQRGWPYYVGEWHEQWYPGYGSAWATFSGSVAILYEQAGVDGSSIKQPNDYLLTYHEAVNHQFTSSLANLFTGANNRSQLLKDFYAARKKIIDDGRKSGLQFLFVPDNDQLKTKRFIESLTGQGIVVKQATTGFTVSSVHDVEGSKLSSRKFPAGTYIVNTAQPMGGLAKTVLEFDPHLSLEFLKEERRELEKHGDTRMYEVSTWSTPLAYDIESYWTTASVSVKSEAVTTVALAPGRLHNPDAAFGYVINMEGEKTYLALNSLMASRVVTYASEKPFVVEDHEFGSGSLVIRKRGNQDDLPQLLQSLATEVGIDIYGVNTGSSSTGSFLSAPSMRLLRQPKVAIFTGEPLSTTAFGSLWFALDKEVGIPHSLIRLSALQSANLDKYNVLVLPSSWGSLSSSIGKSGKDKIENWVSGGGTLICIGSAAAWATDTTVGLSQVRRRRQVLDKLDEYKTALKRELNAEAPAVDTMAIYYPEKVEAPTKEEEKSSKPDKEKLKELDEWQRRFSPDGVIVRAEIDSEDWLSFGMKEWVPVMMRSSSAYLAKKPVTTTARLAAENNLRISGLLWPEGRSRIAETSFLTHESKGKGQIILFTQHPNMRAYFYGTRKMFINALLYGPGLGTRFNGPFE